MVLSQIFDKDAIGVRCSDMLEIGLERRADQHLDHGTPSKSPELNPQENVWQFIRDNWLSNRLLGSHDDIVDHCGDAWNKLVEQPWRIMSIGLRDWAQEF